MATKLGWATLCLPLPQAGTIRVVNNRHPWRLDRVDCSDCAVFEVARPSPLGNPFRIGVDGTRDEVIAKYRTWLEERLQRRDYPAALALLDDIVAAVRVGRRVTLACWCAPLLCHASVVAEIVLRLAGQEPIR